MKIHPNTYLALRRSVERTFNRTSQVELALAAIALPLLSLHWSVRASWALTGFQMLATVALGLIVVQAVLLAGVERANRMSAEWLVSEREEKVERAERCRPKKGFRVPAGGDPCPCQSGQPYKKCCRPVHLAAAS